MYLYLISLFYLTYLKFSDFSSFVCILILAFYETANIEYNHKCLYIRHMLWDKNKKVFLMHDICLNEIV